MLLSDQPTDPDEARDLAATLMPSGHMPQADESGPHQCLQHLLSSPIERQPITGSGRWRATLGQLIGDMKAGSDKEGRHLLGTYGLAVKRLPNQDFDCLVVANQHRGLAQIFHGTRWQKSAWRTDLSRLKGAIPPNRTVWFAGGPAKGVWLPFDELPPLDEAAYEDPPPPDSG